MREPSTITVAKNMGFRPGDTIRLSDGQVLEVLNVQHTTLTVRGLSLLYRLVSWAFSR